MGLPYVVYIEGETTHPFFISSSDAPNCQLYILTQAFKSSMPNFFKLQILSDTDNEVISLQHLSSFFIVIKLENSTIQYEDHFLPLIRFFHFLSLF